MSWNRLGYAIPASLSEFVQVDILVVFQDPVYLFTAFFLLILMNLQKSSFFGLLLLFKHQIFAPILQLESAVDHLRLR